MIICQTLEQAQKVPGVIHIEVGAQIKAFQQGDALPLHCTMDPALIAAEQTRLAAVDGNIAASTFGTVSPATLPELKAMTVAQYGAWFDANFTTAAQAIALLRRLTLVIIRRVL